VITVVVPGSVGVGSMMAVTHVPAVLVDYLKRCVGS
jgi:hypothetical protein